MKVNKFLHQLATTFLVSQMLGTTHCILFGLSLDKDNMTNFLKDFYQKQNVSFIKTHTENTKQTR